MMFGVGTGGHAMTFTQTNHYRNRQIAGQHGQLTVGAESDLHRPAADKICPDDKSGHFLVVVTLI